MVTIAEISTDQLPMFPAADSHYRDAVEEVWTYTGKLKPLKNQMKHIRISDDSGIRMERISAEIKFLDIDFNTNRKVQRTKLVLHGVDVDQSNTLVALLEKRVTVEVLNLTDLQIVGDAEAPEVGQIVTGLSEGETFVGECISLGESSFGLDDFGSKRVVQSVSSALFVETTDGQDVDEHCGRYSDAVEKLDQRPSWAILIQAMALCYGDDKVQRPSGSTMYINAAVVDAAIDLHATGQALPPEAGEVADG